MTRVRGRDSRLPAVLRIAVALTALATGWVQLGRSQSIPVTLGGNASSLVGVDFNLPIEVDLSGRSDKLGGFALTLRWNAGVLQLAGTQGGNFGALTINQDSVLDGVLRVSGVNPIGVGGKVLVALPRFSPLTPDTTTIRVQVSELYAAGSFADLLPSAVPANQLYCPGVGRWGDVDGNGVAGSFDAMVMLSAAVGLNVAPNDPALGDVDGSGTTDTRDALITLSYAVGLDVSSFRVLAVAGGSCASNHRPGLFLVPGNTQLVVGQQVAFTASGADSVGVPLGLSGLTWRSSAPGVATVDAAGVVAGVAAGSTVITALAPGGDSATATIDVVAVRRTHWVDASAVSAVNQLGTPSLPFATIQQGIDFAQAGDSVMVRAGRYEEAVAIQRSVVLMGDTSVGGIRPLIATTSPGSGIGVTITDGTRVELQSLRFDTLSTGIQVVAADTVRLRDIEYRGPSYGYAAIWVDSANALRVERSRIFGAGTGAYYYSNTGIQVDQYLGLLRIDSTLIADFGYYGVNVNSVDSVDVRSSTVRNNYYGFYLCGDCYTTDMGGAAVVFSRNRFLSNGCAGIYLDVVHRVAFDHNVIKDSGCSDAVGIYGSTVQPPLVTFLGDSIEADYDSWLNLYGFDSLSVDSAAIRVGGGSADIENGRVFVVRNSNFRDIQYQALYLYTYPDTGLAIIRNTDFSGPDSKVCDRCGSILYSYTFNVDADSVRTVNLSDAFDVSDASLVLRRSQFQHGYQVFYVDCGSAVVDQVSAQDMAGYAMEVYGCAATDSARLTNIDIQRAYQPIALDYVDAVVTNFTIDSTQYGLEGYGSSLRLADGTIQWPYYEGVYYSGADSTSVLDIQRVTVTCNPAMGGGPTAIYGYDAGTFTVKDNVITNCYSGMYLSNSSGALGTPRGIEVRNNSLAMPASPYRGIYVTGTRARAHVVGNTISGPTPYAGIYGGAGMPWAAVDSNVIDGGSDVSIYIQSVDSLRVFGNTITNLASATCCASGTPAGIMLYGSAATNLAARVAGNHLTNVGGDGIYVYRSGSTDTVHVQIDSNAVKQPAKNGITFIGYGSATIMRNAIDGAGGDGIYVYPYLTATAVAINNNNLSNGVLYGVRNALSSCCLDATSNWWNDALGPSGFYGEQSFTSVGDSVSNYVDWSSQLGAPFGGAPLPSAPAAVAVWQTSPSVVSRVRPVDPSLAAPPDRALRLQERQQRHAERVAALAQHRQTQQVERQAAAQQRAELRRRAHEHAAPKRPPERQR